MRFILEHEQPVFISAIHIHSDPDGAGIDFFGFIKILQLAGLLEILGTDGTKIHQGNRLGCTAGIDFLTHIQVDIIGFLHIVRLHSDIFQMRIEGSMAAVVAPVGIDDHDLGNGRITMSLIPEIILQKSNIRQVHGQAMFFTERFQAGFIQFIETFQYFRQRRLLIVVLQCSRLFQLRFTCFHRVDQGISDLILFRFILYALDVIKTCCSDQRSFTGCGELNALGTGICSLIELTRQILNGKHPFSILRLRCLFFIENIQLRF